MIHISQCMEVAHNFYDKLRRNERLTLERNVEIVTDREKKKNLDEGSDKRGIEILWNGLRSWIWIS